MMDRQEAVSALAGLLTDEIVVPSLGSSNDLYYHRDRPLNFCLMGSMGSATPVALGLALSVPERRVISLYGDGSLLMNLGVLATIGRYAPRNLVGIVLDNQAYQLTGGQPTQTAFGTDLAAVARSCGIAGAVTVESLEEFQSTLGSVLEAPGPHLVVARVHRTAAPFVLARRGLTRPLPLLRYRFMWRLGTLPEAEALTWD